MTYENVNDFVVIADDDRDPDTSWTNHLERGSAGGVDCVAPMRTPVYAPADGVLSGVWLGTGGLTARLTQADGWRDEFMHMDQVTQNGPVKQGDLIGYSGRSGGDYAPHVHWHRTDPDGVRRNPWHYFTGSAPAGSDLTALEGDDDMQKAPLSIYSNVDERGQVYLFGEFTWQKIDDSAEARNLSEMLTGNPQAQKVFGGQINLLKRRVERNRAQLVAALKG